MPMFKIYGANANSGEDVQCKVHAETPDEAQTIANHRQILVARIVEVEGAGEPPKHRNQATLNYAGFWKRVVASVIDGVIMIVLFFIIAIFFSLIYYATGSGAVELLIYILFEIAEWFYFATMESSSKQGTLGKMAMGIKVVDLDGDRIGFGKATGRHFGKIISSIILSMGFVMAGFTEKKQGLHDTMAGCLVVNK